MNYLLKLPFKYTLSINEQIAKEGLFSDVFRSIVEKYHKKDNNIDEKLFFNIMHDFNGNYIRLIVVSPKLPREMNNEIASTFSSVFIDTPVYKADYCMECL